MPTNPGPLAASPMVPCEHCGQPCASEATTGSGFQFCCVGCQAVYELLHSAGMGHFYRLESHPGTRMTEVAPRTDFAYLDRDEISRKLLVREPNGLARATLHIPDIRCVACVWLLENLYRFDPGIGASRVVFPRQELTVHFDPNQIPLSRLVERLALLGYPPSLRLEALGKTPATAPLRRSLWLKLGIAGFVAGNTMLFSVPSYLGLQTSDGLARFMGFASLLLALPVVTYCASDYWRAAIHSLRGRFISLDVPIALGIAALFGQSAFEIVTGRGGGYLDSLAALVFLLLIGRWLQGRTFEKLRFDRSYADYFPLSAATLVNGREQRVPLTSLSVGDRLVVRHGELIPVDGQLVAGEGRIDYSFVTGEADPVPRTVGEELLAGGRQLGGAIEIDATRTVDSSGLMALWDRSSLASEEAPPTFVGQAARWFTLGVLLVAAGAALFWSVVDPSLVLTSFVSVLIVACPCALALATPFATGTARGELARRGLFLRSAGVVERLARATTAVFDKTGTLTDTATSEVTYQGRPLEERDRIALAAVLGGSSHPYGQAVRRSLGDVPPHEVLGYEELAGAGCRGSLEDRQLLCGSRAWLAEHGVLGLPTDAEDRASTVHWASDRVYRGRFEVVAPLRSGLAALFADLRRRLRLVITSGDSARDRDRLVHAVGDDLELFFRQSPRDKHDLVASLADHGPVVMVGDGLNDAAALERSTVGIAVARDVSVFAPACDGLLEAHRLSGLGDFLRFSRRILLVIKTCFAVSIAYNLIGLAFAVSGRLEPVVSAILMPLSSLTVVGLAVGLTHLTARWTIAR